MMLKRLAKPLLLFLVAALVLVHFGPVPNVSAQSEPLGASTVRTAFTPDQIWADTSGDPIDAHGAGVMFDDKTQKYYWYGEYHQGAWPAAGVRVYSSADLLNWKDEGMALTMVKSMADFTTIRLFPSCTPGGRILTTSGRTFALAGSLKDPRSSIMKERRNT
ncbi:hypothetical protein HMSSN036_14080 [Paenibacillus macerans]|nr:hypothetical protein HMSSN036_14080 [Paenibacillus macerans]